MKIAVISSNRSHAEAIERTLQGEGVPSAWDISLTVASLTQLEAVAESEKPDILILDDLFHRSEQLVMLERISLQKPSLAYVILCQNVSPDFLITAMRYGVRDVLQLPLAAGALISTLMRIEQKDAISATPRGRGKIIGVVGCKGGSGATFLASNLGYILAEQGSSVALIDLNLQFGDAALFVSDRTPEYNLCDVAGSNISRLDASYLMACMLKVSPNYSVLAAPDDPELATGIRPDHVEVLLTLARTIYDYVIIDVGRVLNAVTVRALDHADMIFPVLQETLPFIRDAKRILHTLQELGNSREKIYLIVNRHEKGGDIELEDIERTLGIKVFKVIPNSYNAVSASVNQGIPILRIASRDPVTKAIEEIAQSLTEKDVPQEKKSSWFSRFRTQS